MGGKKNSADGENSCAKALRRESKARQCEKSSVWEEEESREMRPEEVGQQRPQ